MPGSGLNRLGLLARLMANGLGHRLSRLTGRPAPLQALSLEITHRCLARCLMCNIWKVPQSVQDIPLSDWVGLLSSPGLAELRELDITGGEPFLRDDLADLVRATAGLKQSRLPQLRSLAVTTNGFLTGRILEAAGAMAQSLAEKEIDLVFACALDAVGELHNRIRGVEGGWERLKATIEGLIDLREAYPNLVLGIKTTVLPQTVDHLKAVAAFAQASGLFAIISPCLITANRYQNMDRQAELRFADSELARLAQFYKEASLEWSYHQKIIRDLLSAGRVTKPCTAGFNYLFIRHTGQVHPCPLIDYSLGDFTRQPLLDLHSSKKAVLFRRSAGSFGECATCTEPGLERYALPAEGFTYARLLCTMKADEFQQLHAHLGLDKYFD